MIDLGPILAHHGVTLADLTMTRALCDARLRAAADDVLRAYAADLCTAPEIARATGLGRRTIAARCRTIGVTLPLSTLRSRRARVSLPVLSAPRLLADHRPVVPTGEERRRGNCASLGACEDAWIRQHLAESQSTGGQARCPRRCSGYAARE